ncbi:hypothetical protein EZS27_008603 [termite gut metagenome]|uniref:Outer membrane protein beta-barrel domain-containing protein n=1 Tax=termite gut metagenome TaxID=433724 RepID=A0A5J4SE83_9ZZZZ
MKRILVLALSLLSLYGYSQTVNVGVRGGLSIPNVIAGGDNPLSKGYSSRFAGTGGAFAELGMNNLLSLRLGVEYSGQGGNRNGVQAMATNQLMSSVISNMGVSANAPGMSAMLGQIGSSLPSIFYADVKNEAKFDYLMIPLSLQVGKDFGKSWRVYVGAGPFVSFLLSAKQVSKGQSELYTDASKSQTLWDIIPSTVKPLITENAPELAYALASEMEFGTTDIKDDLRKVNVGVQGDLGLSYQCNRNKLFLEVGGNYGFVRLQKEEVNGSNRIGSATVMLGYAYRLGK